MPFDLDVADRPREQLTARERLLELAPRLTEEQCAALVHAGQEMHRARREYHARLAAELERPAARLVGPERAAFLEES
jgi:hypothetical protein